MKFEITGRHIEVTPALKAHVAEQFAKIEKVFDGKPAKAHVVIEVERGRHRSEILINWHNDTLTAVSVNSDMYQSLSQSVEKIEKQARKLKDKIIDKSHKAKKAATIVAQEPDEIAAAPRIIQTNGRDAKPMSPDEAILELESGERQFVIFRNSEGGKVSVLFRRSDGNFGLVAP